MFLLIYKVVKIYKVNELISFDLNDNCVWDWRFFRIFLYILMCFLGIYCIDSFGK